MTGPGLATVARADARHEEARPPALEGRRVLVVGAARSGLAAARWLASRGARVTLADARDDADAGDLRAVGVRVELGPHRAETFADAELIVLSPGVPPGLPVLEGPRRAGTPVIGELELAARFLRGRVIAITGTKGKSTTTTLVGRMCERAGLRTRVGGNIGVPVSGQIDDSTPDTIHVLEVSSFQLETAGTFRPWIAVYLNFSPDHLDRHVTIEAYRAAKARIFARQQPEDVAIVNAEDPVAMHSAAAGQARRLPFSTCRAVEPGFCLAHGHVVFRHADGTDEPLVALTSVQLPGAHVLADIVAAAGAARMAGVPPAVIDRTVAEFRGIEHALELVATVDGVRYVNDSKATNIAAARRALESFPVDVVAILGGRFKGGEWRDLREAVVGRVRAIVAIGESREAVREALGDLVPVTMADTMDEAVERARERVPAGGVVLLAPACASFDMFEDYAARGRAFKEAVGRVARTGPVGR